MLNYIIEPLQNNTVDELSLKSFYESNIQMFANPDQYLFEEWIFNSEFERSKLVELLEADNFFKPDFKYKKTNSVCLLSQPLTIVHFLWAVQI